MDAVFGPKLEPNVFVYLDNIVIISDNFEHHLHMLREVKERLSETNLTINFDKCDFFKNPLKYLEHTVDSQGLRTGPDKVLLTRQKLSVISVWVHGIVDLYRIFPRWLRQLKEALMSTPILCSPDFTKHLTIQCWPRRCSNAKYRQ